MTVTVRLFAILRDRAGVASLPLELADDSTVSAAVGVLSGQLPAIATLVRQAAFAVNRQYVPKGTVLRDGDELAIIPPVSGG